MVKKTKQEEVIKQPEEELSDYGDSLYMPEQDYRIENAALLAENNLLKTILEQKLEIELIPRLKF